MKETQGDLLPKFTAEESKLLRSTTIDFFSVNFYCGYYVWAPAPGSPKELVSVLKYRCCWVWGPLVRLASSICECLLRLLRVGTCPWLTQGAGECAVL
jgi:hypothetical protein